MAQRQPSAWDTATAYTGPRVEENNQIPDIPASTSWRWRGGRPRLMAPMLVVARAPAAKERTAAPTTNISMDCAVALSTAPTTVIIVNTTMRDPIRYRDSNHAPTGIMRNIGAWDAASSGPYRCIPSSSVATSGSTVWDR